MANIQPVHSPCCCINYRRAANTLTKYYDAAFAPIGLTGNQFFLLTSSWAPATRASWRNTPAWTAPPSSATWTRC